MWGRDDAAYTSLVTPPSSRSRLRSTRAGIRALPRWRWFALLVVAGGMMMSVINITIVQIALPDMSAEFGSDANAIGWVVTGFLATQATLLPIAGRAGDLYGRYRVFIVGLVVLVLGSVLCALAWNTESIIAFRIIQGIGAATMAPTAFSTVAELFRPEERGAAMGVVVSAISVAPVISLLLAGVLVAAFGWRAVFWFTPVMGAVVLAGIALVLHEAPRRTTDTRFDLPGAALLGTGLFSLLLFLSRSEAWGWFSLASTAALLVAFAALGAFVTWEERAEQPMIDLQLFRLRSLTTANLASFAGAGTLFGVLLAFPFYLAGSLAFGPLAIAFATVPVAIAYTIVSPLAGRWVNRVGFNRLAMSGYAVAGMGAIWLGATAEQRDILLLTPGVVLLGTGLALATTPITTLAISEVPPERIGVASAFPNISRYVGGALGAALLGAILTASVGGVLDEGSATSAAGRAGVAEGFSRASYASLIFLVLAFFTATRMPRTAGR